MLTFMAVHAHPDDEAISTGGVLARYADEGLQTVLVTCTGGEVGEIADPAMATPQTLGEIRRNELEEACRILNVGHLHLLGYRDSGMDGTPANDHPESFHRADLEEATGKLVELVRRYRPQVLVTYDDEGFYGHPDHIKANRITVAAFEAAADPGRYPQAGSPWQPLKLYYVAISRSRAVLFAQRMRETGITPPFEAQEDVEPEFGTPDELITATIDVSEQVERKHRALLAHATQMGPEVFFAQLPEALFHEIFGFESFRLVRTADGLQAGSPEDDLFAGLR
jgi:mycothiol conjugate amidase Mca